VIGLGAVYVLAGLMFVGAAALSVLDLGHPKRWGNAAFWGLVGLVFLAGDQLGGFVDGLIVIVLAALAGFGATGRGKPAGPGLAARVRSATRLGWRLFVPALVIPLTAVTGSLVLKDIRLAGTPLIDPAQATLASLALGALLALAVAMPMLKARPLEPLLEARRLMDTVGWAALLPQTLAALGVVFTLAHVGDLTGALIGQAIPLDNRFTVVAAYAVGMAMLTVVMGNAFAAFPVMTSAIGLPLIVRRFGGDPAVMGAIGMLAGFCGTLTTPMAANFNIVPAALLELPDRWAVIRVQLPTAAIMLVINTALMYLLVFRT
jgi:uncharacterized membrane protein